MIKIYFTNLSCILAFFFQNFCTAQQKVNSAEASRLFTTYQNDTLVKSDSKLLENPSRSFTATEVLNGTLQWKNPYPTVRNNQMQGFDYAKIGPLSAKGIYPRIFTSPKEFKQIQKRS